MKKKIKNKQEKGITLIALVVTIVVLLILAGVSISLVLNNNGVISKSKEARKQYAEAQTNEEKQLEETGDWIEETTTGVVKIEGVVIPEGYYYVGGTKAKGIVISDNPNDNELDKGKEDVRRDLAGNQWVWVPVDTPSSLYTTVKEGIALSGSTGVKTTKYTNPKIISGIPRVKPGDTSHYREPDILIYSGSDDTNYATAGFSSLANMAETMVSEYDEMIRSIEKYKGFYIGRYELSEKGEKTGVTQTDKTWYELYKNCTELAIRSNVKTRMIWGVQWDATCIWLANSGFNITDSTSWGNNSDNTITGHGTMQNTGYSESWKANNIYDFAGNCREFIQESNGYDGRVCRGGCYFHKGSDDSAASRYDNYPNSVNSSYCTRAALYVIP